MIIPELLAHFTQQALTAALKDANLVSPIPQPASDATKLLGDLLIASDVQWSETTLTLIDQVWSAKKTKPAASLHSIQSTGRNYNGTRVSIWKGDITSIDCVGAIVNAANEDGLGCFQPHHVCIDNVIHRQAGPRLRLACKEQMNERNAPLSAGSRPIVTPGFHLPADYIIHVTGPNVAQRHGSISNEDIETLALAYKNILDIAVEKHISSVVIPCISTGLFGFPQDKACAIALSTVRLWLENNPNALEDIVFNVFTDQDLALYHDGIDNVFPEMNLSFPQERELDTPRYPGHVLLAKREIDQADAVLIVAGAGMSGNPGEMVYTNREDFARHYPWFKKWGYNTCYETMGLIMDDSVPETAKWAFFAKHMDNMRWKFAPNQGYQWLLDLVKDKDYFVHTSNVDACFERSGFDKDRIYTPQGEWTYIQCMNACRPTSVFQSRPYLDAIVPHISRDGHIPEQLIPKCPNCGGGMFGNVRAGSTFLHHDVYETQSNALERWISGQTGKVVVLEIGAGFNTPTVTRFLSESIVRSKENCHLIRINPSEPEVPSDIQAIAIQEGWQALGEILKAPAATDNTRSLMDGQREFQLPYEYTRQSKRYGGWKQLLRQLRAFKRH